MATKTVINKICVISVGRVIKHGEQTVQTEVD